MFILIMQIFTAAPKDSLLANAVSYAISIVKADRVQGRGTTNLRYKYFCGYQQHFLARLNRFITFLLDCTFGKMILPRLKVVSQQVLQIKWS